jgi:hypothetical protein
MISSSPPPSPRRTATATAAATAADAAPLNREAEENGIQSVAIEIDNDRASADAWRSLGSRASDTFRRWGQFLAAQRACLLCLSMLCCLVILVTILVIVISGHEDGDRTFQLLNYFEILIKLAQKSS